ncbi:MAG: hypothetical protein F6K40_06100 [Okeania sp. SIO3I5]|uniref:hypothetical protein n=1 Tax=Okeania sp. SIO3I5 TaxID=2607805 RepID=UPI0013B9C785|nr:hypothetical protein [Okeania sp. SIO3I5]NEQ35880.1 hypothetical protein [Okeania sp. SIO3I5]
MTPGQQDQYQFLKQSEGFDAAERYRDFVEAPDYLEVCHRTFPDYLWTIPEQQKKLRIKFSSQERRRFKFSDYGNTRPSK